jgi:nitroreductase
LRSRRSRRVLTEAPLEDVAFVIRETMRTDFFGTASNEGRKRKAFPSAGAVHPVQAVLIDGKGTLIHYDDVADRFVSFEAHDNGHLNVFLRECKGVIPTALGHWVFFFTDTRDLSDLYSGYVSLAWRDAGAAIQTMALVAEACGLGFCPLGILGKGLMNALFAEAEAFVPVGVAAIGGRVNAD